MSEIWRFVSSIGALRVMLAIITVLLIAAAPFSEEPAELSGWSIIPGAVVPALVVIVAFVLPVDITISGAFLSESHGAEQTRYRLIVRMQSALLAGLVLTWAPVIALRLGYFE